MLDDTKEGAYQDVNMRSYNEETDSSLITFSTKLGLKKKRKDIIIGNTFLMW